MNRVTGQRGVRVGGGLLVVATTLLSSSGVAEAGFEPGPTTVAEVTARPSKPGTTTVAEIRSRPNTIHSALVGRDRRNLRTCKSTAYFFQSVVWRLGKVTKKSIQIKSLDLWQQGGREVTYGSLKMLRGTDGKQVWLKKYWQIPRYQPNRLKITKFKVNKTVPVRPNKPIQLLVNWEDGGKRGERGDCYGQSLFIFKLKPGTYTHEE
ncbi:hypothetical protein ABZV75_19895 [Streptomyces flaveolus]|uniref:hypothetical protein n=1 Tax=Streptomyces flaveolus TaxID=67297 RepID=UPI0033B583F0